MAYSQTARLEIGAALAKYRVYHRVIENLVYMAGVWPHHEATGSFYRFIAFFGMFVSTATGTKVLIHTLSDLSNMMQLAMSMRFMSTAYAVTVRVANFLVYRKELVFLDDVLDAKFTKELEDEKNQSALLKKISVYSKFMHFLNLSTAGAVVMYLVPMFILNFKYKKSVPLLPGKFSLPVEPRSSLYWIMFAMDGSMFVYAFFTITGVDNAFGLHCFRICGLLRLASERFNEFDPDNPDSRDQLRECLAIHQLVIRAKQALQTAYGVVIMWNYITCSIVMCTLLWQINQVKSQENPIKLVYVVFYLSVKMVQCFIYAYYGACITVESEHYKDAIYTCKWPGSKNVRLAKDLLLILTQPTISLKACGFFLISMQFFEKICNTTISYFFLLQSMEAKR